MAACGERIVDDGIPDKVTNGPDTGTSDSCWPTESACYLEGSKDGEGGECMAKRDNSVIDSNGLRHVQLRQTWLRAMRPDGNTAEKGGPVYGALTTRSQLWWPECNNYGNSGYSQLFNFTLNTTSSIGDAATDGSTPYLGEAWIGFSKFVPNADTQQAVTDGLCMVEGTLSGTGDKYALPDSAMSPSADYPVGLPKPMGRATNPWIIKPTHAKRLAQDFVLPRDRLALLASLAPGSANATAGYDAVFYFDETTGASHGFSPLSFLVIYDAATQFITVPVREAETRSQFNDPTFDCVGAYRGDALLPADSCGESKDTTSEQFPAWGCSSSHPCTRGEAPATTDGYFLITEIEQVYSAVLQSTLCVSYPTFTVSQEQGWVGATDKWCRGSTKWDPTTPATGLPMGDWCAATNSAATPSCHDAYKSFSYHVFAGFPVKDPAVVGGTCAF